MFTTSSSQSSLTRNGIGNYGRYTSYGFSRRYYYIYLVWVALASYLAHDGWGWAILAHPGRHRGHVCGLWLCIFLI